MRELKIDISKTNRGKYDVFNQISHDIGFLCPEYKFIKSQVIRDINKGLLPNISSFPFLFKNYCDDPFVDDTFYVAPDFSYKVFITRNFVPELNEFYNTSFSLLRNKEQETYRTIVESHIKYCNNLDHNRNLYVYYNAILNLPFINPECILDIFHKIKKSCININYNQFLIFLEYFRKTYLILYDIEN
ncbi:hypothetical protein H8356DRAFT_1362201 [Neocallimastix lanati (nom. inval.)]|nr:hypothetical protein H8356DRAFT_1362201 [Neocallimastix sp. JGI-2020a]